MIQWWGDRRSGHLKWYGWDHLRRMPFRLVEFLD